MNARAAVLVVEDESHLRTTMSAVLALRGFHPLPAPSVDVALRLLGTERVDAIVLDLRLPDPTGLHQSGLDLLRFVRATTEHAQIPVVVFTGMPLSPSEEEIVRRNRAHVFFKPQPYAVLCDHLSMMLEGATPQ
jgi:DNA-binding response OmpR family regulator